MSLAVPPKTPNESKIMKKLLAACVALPLLSGCAAELAAAGAIVVTAPVWVPIEYGVSQSKVKQPVEVVTRNGRSLIPAFAGEPEAKLIVQNDAVICTGAHPLSKKNTNGLVSLKCNGGLKGRLNIGGLTTSKAMVTVGPASALQRPDGQLSELSQSCSGNFNKKKSIVASFLLECEDGRYGVISPKSAAPDASEFTVWLPPSL